MAPEVLRGEPVSAACDVFSWGCLMAFAASGRAPFGGEALPAVLYQVLNTEPTLEGMEPTLHELVTYALAKDPRNRPTSQQLLDHLVGRSAAPEQAAHSVQTSWQGTPGTYESAPWAGPAGVPGGPSPTPAGTTPRYPPRTAARSPAPRRQVPATPRPAPSTTVPATPSWSRRATSGPLRANARPGGASWSSGRPRRPCWWAARSA